MAEIDIYKADEGRYGTMRYNHVGRSGLKFPAVSLGFWHNFGSNGNYDNMKAMCRTAFDNGITQFDLANNYGPVYGSAEISAGRILREDFRPYRDELVITTKAGYDMWEGPYGNWGSKKYLVASLDQSLGRLGLEYVDIFYHHRMDPETPLEETMEALAQIVRSGKALYAGISNYNEEYTRRAMEIMKELHCPLIVNQRRYSIFDRTIEKDGVKRFCHENGMGIIAFSPLAQGLLTDRYLHGIPADSRIASDGRFLKESSLTEERLSQIRALDELAAQRGQTLAEMALAWILKDDEVCSVLIGASRPEQILDNIKAIENCHFSEEELTEIDRISLS
ncbi:MAG: aldo/keto reductase [Blautia sp.]|nr:aldo/keto reductase [Blautia sp.]